MKRQERLTERNKKVRQLFANLCKKNPKWRIDAVIEDVANTYFLAPRTVEAIIGYEGIYNDNYPRPETSQLKMF